MRVILHVFFALLFPTVSYSLIKSNLRVHASNTSSLARGDRMWPFNIFGGGGRTKGTFKQTLENFGDTQYFGTIEVGGQTVKAVIDTGSFELLVFGTSCTHCGNEKHLYDNSKSQSSTVTDFEAKHSFGSGTTRSKRTLDTLKVGHLSVPNQSFWEVYDADMLILSDGRFQSIFGIGPPSSAIKFAERDDKQVHREVKELKKGGEQVTSRIKQIVDHYDDMVDLMKNVTSVYENLNIVNMSICLGEKTGSPGYFFWDDHATRSHPEKFAQVNVRGDIYWSAILGDVHLANATVHGEDVSKDLWKVASETINIGCANSNCSAIVDTGTSLLVAPKYVVDEISELATRWEAAGGSCEDLSQLPDLRFTLNGLSLSLPPEAYMGFVSGDMHGDLATYMPRLYKKYKHHKNLTKEGSKHNRTSTDTNNDPMDHIMKPEYCEPLVMSMDASSQFGDLWILGMPFFRKYYTSFEFVQMKGKLPRAATMSFSEQDGKCRPGSAPQTPQSTKGRAHSKLEMNAGFGRSTEHIFQGPRRAQLQIDTSKIFVPRVLQDARKKSVTSKLMRPFVHI